MFYLDAAGLKGAKKQAGFTLVELIIVFVILSVLAVAAIPAFINLGRDSRVAALNAMAGTVKQAAEGSRLKCRTTPGCDISIRSSGYITLEDGQHYLWYGYPDGGDPGQGIDLFIQYSGFSVVFTHSAEKTSFQLNAAPTPASCSVDYVGGYFTTTYTFTVNTAGC